MRRIKPINYKKIFHEVTLKAGILGTYITIMMSAFLLYMSRRMIYSSAEERAACLSITLVLAVVSLLLFVLSMILDDRAE